MTFQTTQNHQKHITSHHHRPPDQWKNPTLVSSFVCCNESLRQGAQSSDESKLNNEPNSVPLLSPLPFHDSPPFCTYFIKTMVGDISFTLSIFLNNNYAGIQPNPPEIRCLSQQQLSNELHLRFLLEKSELTTIMASLKQWRNSHCREEEEEQNFNIFHAKNPLLFHLQLLHYIRITWKILD
ncbi:uncharacterized protein LOC107011866 [Solanum pennellii]|uniref:Uncharacterized protein LOC107011866 n=1 Tax=Solanum pennellii TaxID=28526 RepID=A0ABM1G7F2_SOLPN|nr:uncharacterized protein LOC107011866 [Solanum pennellii]